MTTNRHQRRERAQQTHETKVELRAITMPTQMEDKDCAIMLNDRVVANLLQTGHPLHHRTHSGVIVSSDPTADYYIQRLQGKPSYEGQLAKIAQLVRERDALPNLPPRCQ